jgi:hypothetical protein
MLSPQAAGLSNLGLIGGEFSPQIEPGLIIPGREHERLRSQEMSVSAGFFETMRIHLLEGRDFTARDADSESGAVIVSESFAQRYFPEGNSLGNCATQPWPQSEVERQRDKHAPDSILDGFCDGCRWRIDME